MRKVGYLGMIPPPLASKQAELSRGLTKNLAQQASKPFPKRTTGSLSKGKYRGESFSKYQSSGGYSNPSRSQFNFHGYHKKRKFSSLKGTSARISECINWWRTLTSDPEILSLVSGYEIRFYKLPFRSSPKLPIHRVREHF